MQNVLKKVLNEFIARDGIVAAALIGTDGLIIESASHKNIDMDRISALFSIYFANTADNTSNFRLLPLPKSEEAAYVLLANVSGALFVLFTNSASRSNACDNFNNNIKQIKLALKESH
jgi:predicted regulator of Ras-like GTPase activity (Roadblock/LC7/MglB family)